MGHRLSRITTRTGDKGTTGLAVRECLMEVQQRLFEVGAQLSSPGQRRITEADVLSIERAVEHFNAELEPLKEFVLPGGSLAGAACHVARTVCVIRTGACAS